MRWEKNSYNEFSDAVSLGLNNGFSLILSVFVTGKSVYNGGCFPKSFCWLQIAA